MTKELRVIPRRNSVLGVPPSAIHTCSVPSSLVCIKWIQEWGLIHSTRVIGPLKATGKLASNSAENAWCAVADSLTPMAAMPPTTATAATSSFIFMLITPICLAMLGTILLFLVVGIQSSSRPHKAICLYLTALELTITVLQTT